MNVKIANAFYFFLVIICCGMIIFLAYHHFFDRETAVQRGSNRRTPVVRAIEKAMPSVVNLRTKRFSAEGGDMTAAGCGIIIDQSGLILTNAHVVSGAGEIFATLSSGSVCRAYVVAENLKNDIALLKLENPPVFLPVIPLMRPWKLLLGETVIAVGNPYGLDGSITVGILSGINRSLADGGRLLFTDLLQTDAAVFPGNSGGPLINLDGCMIGMNMAIKRNAPGISFAVPLFRIENVLAEYLLPERMQNLDFGIKPQCDPEGNILIGEVFPGSPAAEAGITAGMQLLTFDQWNPEHDLLSLCRKMIRLESGKKVILHLKELGKIELVPRPLTEEQGAALAELKLGIRVVPLSQEAGNALNGSFRSGIIVTGVPDAENVFRRGDIISEINGEKTETLKDLGTVLKNIAPGSIVTVVVHSIRSDFSGMRYWERRVFRLRIR